MNKKGFMLLETLVVSTFILGILIFLFIQLSTIKRAYDTSFRYNTVTGLYHAKEFSKFLLENGYDQVDNKLANTTSGYVDITSCPNLGLLCGKIEKEINAKRILYVSENISSLQNNLSTSQFDTNLFNSELKKFILQMNSVEPTGKNRLIIEYNDNTYATITLSVSHNE